MSLLDDTIGDARRPLTAYRAASTADSADSADHAGFAELAESVEARRSGARAGPPLPAAPRAWPPTAPAADDDSGHGASDFAVAREERAPHDEFQREGQSMSREASFPSGSGTRRWPTGDPLSAGMGAERPKLSATSVGMTDVTVMGDSRTSELATGPEQGRSPGKVAAAAASSESKSSQSVVLPGPIEAEWSCSRSMSMTPEGSTRPVSASGETFLSRLPGRGAPSETPSRGGGHVARPGSSADSGSGAHEDTAAGGCDAPKPALAPGLRARDAGRAGPPPYPRVTAGVRPAEHDAIAPSGRQGRHSAGAGGDTVPTLSIGRIEVTVVADAPRAAPQRTDEAFSDAGFFACNYLKRL